MKDCSLFQPVHTGIETLSLEGEQVLRVVKTEKIWEFDENTYAKLPQVSFHNGVIQVDMRSRLLPDAPDLARGFVGIAFRIQEDDSAFESFYVRPPTAPPMTRSAKPMDASIFPIPPTPSPISGKRESPSTRHPSISAWIPGFT